MAKWRMGGRSGGGRRGGVEMREGGGWEEGKRERGGEWVGGIGEVEVVGGVRGQRLVG